MALFSFGDIRFNTTTRKGFGPTGNLLGSGYNYDILRYPVDIGNYDKGHYMVIHINEQVKTQFESRAANNGDLPTIIQNRLSNGTATVGSNFVNIFDYVKSNLPENVTEVAGKIYDSTGFQDSESIKLGFLRTIKRTSDTIALYMPDTLQFTHYQEYSEPSIAGAATGLLAAGNTVVDALKNNPGNSGGAMNSIVRNLSPLFASYFSQKYFGDLGRVGFAAVAGRVTNPMLEVLFTSPRLREFRFDFMLYPRSEDEAKEVQKILDLLRFHQAPEFDASTSGFLMVPPSEFDIKFYYNGKENPNIPKVSTCVLTSIDLDYAPNGFAAYESPKVNVPSKGGTGMPVAIRLSLNFKETEYMTKSNYARPSTGVAFRYNTTPGSEQTRMLEEQESGFDE